MVTVAKGNFTFPILNFLLYFYYFCREMDETEKKMVRARVLCLLLINQFLYPLNLVGNSTTTGVSF